MGLRSLALPFFLTGLAVPASADPAAVSTSTAPAVSASTAAVPSAGPEEDPYGAALEVRGKAEAGSAEAQYKLGGLFRDGHGVEQSFEKALVWLKRAADQGHAKAMREIGSLYGGGQGVPRDAGAQRDWLLRAAEAGEAKAQYDFAVMTIEGRRSADPYAEAVPWFRRAAEQNFAPAQYRLGWHLFKGLGVGRDLREAYFWTYLAVLNGQPAGNDLKRIARRLPPGEAAELQDRAKKRKEILSRPEAGSNAQSPPKQTEERQP